MSKLNQLLRTSVKESCHIPNFCSKNFHLTQNLSAYTHRAPPDCLQIAGGRRKPCVYGAGCRCAGGRRWVQRRWQQVRLREVERPQHQGWPQQRAGQVRQVQRPGGEQPLVRLRDQRRRPMCRRRSAVWKFLDEEMLETKFVALSTCFQTYFYQCNLFLRLRDENALNMMETLKLPNRFFALSKATVDVHQF